MIIRAKPSHLRITPVAGSLHVGYGYMYRKTVCVCGHVGWTGWSCPSRMAKGGLCPVLTRFSSGCVMAIKSALRYGGLRSADQADAGQETSYIDSSNPNGSVDDIAGICDPSGLVLGLMPHPERCTHFTHHPQRGRLASAQRAEIPAGLRMFQNAVGACPWLPVFARPRCYRGGPLIAIGRFARKPILVIIIDSRSAGRMACLSAVHRVVFSAWVISEHAAGSRPLAPGVLLITFYREEPACSGR